MNQFQKIVVGPGVHQAVSAAKHTQRWSALVARIRHQDGEALGELYATLRRTYPYYFCRKLGADHAADATHTIFLAAVGEIREGRLREPECLMAFVHAIARNYTCQQIGRKCRANETAFDDVFQLPDERKSIEQNVIAEERHQLVMECLGRLHPHHKEILVRFYLREERSEHIQQEMDLTPTQFHLLKSRAKSRFGEIGRRKIKFLDSPLAAVVARAAAA